MALMSFAQWKATVSNLMLKIYGLHPDDMPDWNWRDSFEYGYTPKEALDMFMQEQAEYEYEIDEP